MHYIRFLKVPSATTTADRSSLRLQAKITIETDLGDAFLCHDLELTVSLHDHSASEARSVLDTGAKWTAYARALEISLAVPRSHPRLASCSLRVEARSPDVRVRALEQLLPGFASAGAVVGVESSPFEWASDTSLQLLHPGHVLRTFRLASGECMAMWEERGDGIARHIWDAGLLLAAYLDRALALPPLALPPSLALDRRLRSQLNRRGPRILELGAGCGIIGIVAAHALPHGHVHLTDLPAAADVARRNIAQQQAQQHGTRVTYPDLDWTRVTYANLDWTRACAPAAAPYDLVVAGDVTYNCDALPSLVRTLASVAAASPGVLLLLAMKVRHDSEAVFFDLAAAAGFVALAEETLPLPLLGDEDQEVRVFLFDLGGPPSELRPGTTE